MRRSLAVVLGLVAMGVGLWLMTRQSAQNAACNATNAQAPHMGSLCQHIVYSYMASVALIVGGLIFFLFGAVVMKKQNMKGRRRRRQPIKLPQREWEKIKAASGPI